ncbi:MAG: hypothetical protein MR927_06585 [Campylobacter sp.]|nr:hypothetical protein [Campylobacter sp.]
MVFEVNINKKAPLAEPKGRGWIEFPASPSLPCVILRLDRGISSQRILKFPASLRGSKAEGAISSHRRHCEGEF